MKVILVFFVMCFILVGKVNAQSHKAHTHGVAKLSIVLDNEDLLLEIETPAENILGFEHSPHTTTEKQQLKKALVSLNNPDSLFLISPACQLKTKDVDAPFKKNTSSKHEEHHHDKKQKHAREHLHEDEDHHHKSENHDEDEHHAKEQKHEHGESQHQDFYLTYHWHCPKTRKINIQVKLFDVFSGFEKVDAQWIAFDKQNAKVLQKQNASLELSP